MTIIGTALVAGLLAFGLTGWMHRVAKVKSVWLQYYLHVVIAAALGAGAALMAEGWAEFVGFTLLAVGCALLTCVDLAAMRLPNIMVGPLYLALLVALSVATLVSGDWLRLVQAIGVGVAMVAVYLLLAIIRPGQLGMGDVKFGGVIGLFLGWLGWGEVLLGMLAAFILSAVVGLGMMWFFKMTKKHMLPFGPFMVAGAAVGAAIGPSFLVIA
jgi:leader peptidase (prepilin peptidase)/N-methyltransferase